MRNILFHVFYGRILLIVFAYLFLVSPASGLSQWEKIQHKGYLTWVTRPSPLTYYTSIDGIIGLEYDILKRFCESHGIDLSVVIASSNNELFELFDGFNVDIAGANLSLTDKRKANYKHSIGYDKTSINLISSLSKPKIKSLDELHKFKGVILNNSSYESIANNLIQQYQANIDVLDDVSLYELLQKITIGELDFTLSDSNIINIFRAYIPRLRIGKKLSEESDLVFYTRNNSDNSLLDKLDEFIDDYKLQDNVAKYKKFLTQTLPNSKPADTVNFLKNYKNRWPKVRPIIYAIAEKHNVSPILLGAISYQESHWNSKAISPTLVKGLMMLTKDVAKEQNVTDRFDALQSLEGGTLHFLKMMKKVPKRITEPDRTNFAMAAYNLGYGHVEKARVMTQAAGKNPDLWKHVKLYLPELNNLEGYKADGKTAVRYVENIHVYQNLLQWKEQQ